jgi:hypothetical protein
MMPNAASKLGCPGQVKIINPGARSIVIYRVCGASGTSPIALDRLAVYFQVWKVNEKLALT